MRILVKEFGSIILDVVIDRSPIYIGSSVDCAVHLADMRIGGHHASLRRDPEGQWTVTALSGHIKTLLNGHVVTDDQVVSNGDQITIQDYTLNVYLDTIKDEPEAVPAAQTEGESKKYPVPLGTMTRSRRQDVAMTPEQVDAFAALSAKLLDCVDASALIDTVLSGLMEQFRPRTAWIGLRRKAGESLELTQGRDHHGQLFEAPKLYPSLAYRCLQRGLNVWIPKLDDPDTHSLIAVPLHTADGRMGFLYLDSKKDATPFSERDFHLAMALSALVTQKLEALKSQQARVRQVASTIESDMVHAIQQSLDPLLVPDWPELQVAVHCSPGKGSTGDVYDIRQLSNRAAAFLIGRLTGEGITPALGIVEARTAFRVGVLDADMPHSIMAKLNWLLCSHSQPLLMDCAIIMIDPGTGALLHCMAGQARALIISHSGSVRQMQSPQSLALGKSEQQQFTTRKSLLGADESLALYTPGLLQLQDPSGQTVKEERVIEILCDGFGMSARAALDEIISDLRPYLSGGYNCADATIMLAHRSAE
jgi:serine phosphatase RsbU (regulator of sigma subunit)